MLNRFFKTLLGQLLFFLSLDKLADFWIVHLWAAFFSCFLSTIWLFIFQKKCSFPLSQTCIVWSAAGCRLVLAEILFRMLGFRADCPRHLHSDRHITTTHNIRADQAVFNVTPDFFTYFLLKLGQFKHTVFLSASPPAAVQSIRQQTGLILSLVWFVPLLFDSSAEHCAIDIDLTDARFASLFFVPLLGFFFFPSFFLVFQIFLFTLRSFLLLFSKELFQQLLRLLLFKIWKFIMACLLRLFEILGINFRTLFCTFSFAIDTRTVVNLRGNQTLGMVIRPVGGARAQLSQ